MENTTITNMKNSFQDGVDSIYNAIVGQGTTPSGKTPADLVNGIGVLATNKYNAGVNYGKTQGISVINFKTDYDSGINKASSGIQFFRPLSIKLSPVTLGYAVKGTITRTSPGVYSVHWYDGRNDAGEERWHDTVVSGE